jgi:hypothetical protein
MKYLPSLALALLVVTALRGVFTGVPVNFPALLLGAVVVCGIAWAVDKFYLAKRRAAGEVLHWGIEVPASIFYGAAGRVSCCVRSWRSRSVFRRARCGPA